MCIRDRFHVYAVREVDEALALLVGKPVGAQDEKGRFPKGSVNDLVVARLQAVSYTHLDVYKRQSSTRKPSPWPCSPCWRLWWRSTRCV